MKRLERTIQFLVVLSAICLFIGLLNRWLHIADLVCQFRLFTACFTVFFGLILFILGSRKWASGSLAIGILFLSLILPFAFPFYLVSGRGASYHLLSFNVLVSNDQKELVTKQIKDEDPDFILLFEINSSWKTHLEKELVGNWPHHKFAISEGAFGVAIFSKFPLTETEVIRYPGAESTPLISAMVELGEKDQPLRLIATHPVPPLSNKYWQARNRVFENLADDVREGPASRTIVAGDLNCSPWCYWVRLLVTRAELQFASRYRGIQMTWRPVQNLPLGLHIDHILTGRDILVFSHYSGEFCGSDHRPVMIRFR